MSVERFRFETHDQDEAVEAIRAVYAVHRPHVSRGGSRGFVYAQQRLVVGDLAVDCIRHSLDAEAAGDPFDALMFLVTVSGRLALSVEGDEVRMGRGDVAVYPLGEPLTVRWSDVDARALTLPRERVADAAAARTGIDPADFRFETLSPGSRSLGRHWRDTVGYVYQTLNAPESGLDNPLLRTAAIDLVANVAVGVFPNTATSAGYLRGPGAVSPAAVRRAATYIDEHAGDPLTMTEIARAAGVGPRALQTAFNRTLGTSPMAYLRRVRLVRAHRDLQTADPTRGDTVADVAHRWGWGNLGRFAAAYRAEFGQPPSRTLRA